MKAISLVPSESIRNSQLNSSTAKQSFGFSKAQRFKAPAANCPVAFYSNSCELSRRKTSFGYGKKSDFTVDLHHSPAANLYTIQSFFENSDKKGKSMGVSRDMSPENGIINRNSLKVPGVAQYDLAQVDNKLKKKICFTMRPKTLDFIEIKDTSKKNPGPASYEFVEAFPKTGKCYLSKFTSSKYAILSKSDRFNKTKESPGPQSYIIRDNFPKEGKYVQSKHMGQGTRPFSHAARRGFTDTISRDNISPGVGLYEQPSQFGVYGDTRYYKTLSNFSKRNETIT